MKTSRSRLVALAAFGIPVAFLLSVAAVVVGALTERVLVTGRSDQTSVGFGRPLVWVHQDQTSSDPPFPWATNLSSPWEHPTRVSGVPFLLDVIIVFALVAALGLVVAALVVGLRRRLESLRG